MDFCKEIVIIIYNYIHRDLMKYVVSEYKQSVIAYCNNNNYVYVYECNDGVCESSILVGSRKVEYNYRDFEKKQE